MSVASSSPQEGQQSGGPPLLPPPFHGNIPGPMNQPALKQHPPGSQPVLHSPAAGVSSGGDGSYFPPQIPPLATRPRLFSPNMPPPPHLPGHPPPSIAGNLGPPPPHSGAPPHSGNLQRDPHAPHFSAGDSAGPEFSSAHQAPSESPQPSATPPGSASGVGGGQHKMETVSRADRPTTVDGGFIIPSASEGTQPTQRLPPNANPQFFPRGRSGFMGSPPGPNVPPGAPTAFNRPPGMPPGAPTAFSRPPGPGGLSEHVRLPRHSGHPGAGAQTDTGGPPRHHAPGHSPDSQQHGSGLMMPPPPISNRPPGPGGPPGELNRPPTFGGLLPPRPGGELNRPTPPLKLTGPAGDIVTPPGEINRPPGMGGPFIRPGDLPYRPSPSAVQNLPPMNRPLRPGVMGPDGPHPLMGGPPGPFPHGAPTSGPLEVWFEHTTADGKVYYSHAQTQKTSWERPHNSQILLPPPSGPPGGAPFPDPAGPFGTTPPPFPSGFPPLPGNPQLVPTKVWSDHQTPDGKVYYYNKVTKQSVWEKPKDFELIMPLPISFSAPSPITAAGNQKSEMIEKSEEGDDESGRMEGIEGGKQQEIDVGVADSGGGKKEEQKKIEGTEQTSGDAGPDVNSLNTHSHSKPSPAHTPSGLMDSIPPQITSIPLQNFPPPAVLLPTSLMSPTHPNLIPPQSSIVLPPSVSFQPNAPPVLAKQEPKGPRPVASVPVQGTPWSIVWSSDDRTFFFNATNRVSVWSVPEELEGNPNVEKILENPPGGKKRGSDARSATDSKRLKLSDSDDSDEEDMEIEGVVLVGDLKTSEGGAEAELKAAKDRASKSLEERQQEFKNMLLERGVSAFSTWEKELPKFVFDPRYMLLTVKERKACFESFIRSRTEEERREKKNKLKEMRDRFRSLLEEAKLHTKTFSFSEFAAKYGKDDRFKAVEKMREREQMFTEYLGEIKKSGNRQKVVEQQKSSKGRTDKVMQDFLTMLRESEAVTEWSQWKKIKGLFDHDPRYKAVDGSTKREELFKEHLKTLKDKNKESDPQQERLDRIQASLKEREREVQMTRSAHEKEWGRERDQLRKMDAQQHFKALLADLVRVSQVQWHEVKRTLRKDHRWELTKLLDHNEREQMFQEHVLGLANKKRLQFRKLLEETPQISLSMPWRKARKLIKEDTRYKSFTDSDHKREVEYDKYQMDKIIMAKNDFRSLLKETKLITYKSRDLVRDSERHYKDILELLKNDKRYLVLDCIAEEREDILYGYLDDLHCKGPPPPPTATHPGERLKRPGPT